MRILFVHSIGRKKYGGGERWVVNAASGLQELGHFVVVGGRNQSVLHQEAEKKGVQTAVFNIYSNLSIYEAFRLSRFIRKHKIEVVICKGHELNAAGLAARWSNNPLVIRRAGSPPQKRSRKLIWRTKWFVDGVVTNTSTIKEVYARHGFTDDDFVGVIYNGLQTDDEVAAFDFSKSHPGKTIVLCIGRAVGHKGYFFLIDALPALQEKHPELLFYVLGEGKDRNQLIQYARKTGVENMICFAGYRHEPIPYVKGCDLFLHPSLYEGMPNAAMEAMAYGKPVIMTRVNGAEELSDNGKYAMLIPPADSSAIESAISDAIEHKEEFHKMGLLARSFVREKFGMHIMANALDAFIRNRWEKKQKKI